MKTWTCWIYFEQCNMALFSPQAFAVHEILRRGFQASSERDWNTYCINKKHYYILVVFLVLFTRVEPLPVSLTWFLSSSLSCTSFSCTYAPVPHHSHQPKHLKKNSKEEESANWMLDLPYYFLRLLEQQADPRAGSTVIERENMALQAA